MTITADMQTDSVPAPLNSISFSAAVQTDQPHMPPPRVTLSGVMQTIPHDTHSELVQTEDTPKSTQSGLMQTEKRETSSIDSQTPPVNQTTYETQTDQPSVVGRGLQTGCGLMPPPCAALSAMALMPPPCAVKSTALSSQQSVARSAADLAPEESRARFTVQHTLIPSVSRSSTEIKPLPFTSRSTTEFTPRQSVYHYTPEIVPHPSASRFATAPSTPQPSASATSRSVTEVTPQPSASPLVTQFQPQMSAKRSTTELSPNQLAARSASEIMPQPAVSRSAAQITLPPLATRSNTELQLQTSTVRSVAELTIQLAMARSSTNLTPQLSAYPSVTEPPSPETASRSMPEFTDQPVAERSSSGLQTQPDLRPYKSGFMQTDVDIRSQPKSVRSYHGQTDHPPMKVTLSGIQTDTVTYLPPLKISRSAIHQTDYRDTLHCDMMTEPMSESQASPVLWVRPVASGFIQTDEQHHVMESLTTIRPLRESKSTHGQTDPALLPETSDCGGMQTDEWIRKMMSACWETEGLIPELKHGQLMVTQTPGPPEQVLGETQTDAVARMLVGAMQTDLVVARSATNQTDPTAVRDTGIGGLPLQFFTPGTMQTDTVQVGPDSAQTDFPEKECPAVLAKVIGEDRDTQTDIPKAVLHAVQTDVILEVPRLVVTPPVEIPLTALRHEELSPPPPPFVVHLETPQPPPTLLASMVEPLMLDRENEPVLSIPLPTRAPVAEPFPWPDLGIRDGLSSFTRMELDLNYKPLWILVLLLGFFWLAHWLEIHKAMAKYTSVTDWKYGDQGLGSAQAVQQKTLQRQSGGKTLFDNGGEMSTERQVSSGGSNSGGVGGGGGGSWFGGGKSSDRPLSESQSDDQQANHQQASSQQQQQQRRNSPPDSLTAYEKPESATGRSWFGSRVSSLTVEVTTGRDDGPEKTTTREQHRELTSGSWFGGGGSKSQGMSSIESQRGAPTSSHREKSSSSWFTGGRSQERPACPTTMYSERLHKGSSWFSGSSSPSRDSMSPKQDDTRKASGSWFGSGKSSNSFPDGLSAAKSPTPKQQCTSRCPDGVSVIPTSSGQPPGQAPNLPLSSEPPRTTRENSLHPQNRDRTQASAQASEGAPTGAPALPLPGFESLYRSALWSPTSPSVVSYAPDALNDHRPLGYKSGSGPSYVEPPYVVSEDVPVRSYFTELLFGPHQPRPILMEPKTYQLAPFRPNMMSVLPIVRSLALTTPELGSTKQWLHGLPWRFDPGRIESWAALRIEPRAEEGCGPKTKPSIPLHKKQCVDQFFSIEHYVTCRVAHTYDHARWDL